MSLGNRKREFITSITTMYRFLFQKDTQYQFSKYKLYYKFDGSGDNDNENILEMRFSTINFKFTNYTQVCKRPYPPKQRFTDIPILTNSSDLIYPCKPNDTIIPTECLNTNSANFISTNLPISTSDVTQPSTQFSTSKAETFLGTTLTTQNSDDPEPSTGSHISPSTPIIGTTTTFLDSNESEPLNQSSTYHDTKLIDPTFTTLGSDESEPSTEYSTSNSPNYTSTASTMPSFINSNNSTISSQSVSANIITTRLTYPSANESNSSTESSTSRPNNISNKVYTSLCSNESKCTKQFMASVSTNVNPINMTTHSSTVGKTGFSNISHVNNITKSSITTSTDNIDTTLRTQFLRTETGRSSDISRVTTDAKSNSSVSTTMNPINSQIQSSTAKKTRLLSSHDSQLTTESLDTDSIVTNGKRIVDARHKTNDGQGMPLKDIFIITCLVLAILILIFQINRRRKISHKLRNFRFHT
ncbi:hypothetical protein RF11_03081 [Thelohanellus kitauei]|uniref:Uncharacterized protein n=1 Tax=Thelohanellus kitauei TaxID=669202 RepID=A0A0C2N765_THEKT|nr:hypothetical protein RF11_03081 [Thelohanellus kitauei]